jgi:predicted DsbA family dithiol-disulfide isomerase
VSGTAPVTLPIDIWSDVMCPWCLIGYGQLTRALALLEGEIAVEIRWRPFELNPDMPPEGEEQALHLQRKYRRSPEETAALRARMAALADDAGVSLAWQGEGDPPPAMMWNTRDCHKLLSLALDEAGPQVQTRLKLALFRAHFNHRANLSDRRLLLDIAAQSGLHREAAKAALDDPARTARVIAEENEALDRNITGVPAMIVAGAFLIPGAQDPETYAAILRRIAGKIAVTV